MDTKEHYCTGCKETHIDEGYRWNKDGDNWYCGKFMNCVGCGKWHKKTFFIKHKKIETKDGIKEGWFCEKWVRDTRRKKLSNMSPADVMSGVDLGMDRQDCYGSDNDMEDWSVEHASQMDTLDEIL